MTHDRYDVNGDGVIDVHELRYLLEDLHESIMKQLDDYSSRVGLGWVEGHILCLIYVQYLTRPRDARRSLPEVPERDRHGWFRKHLVSRVCYSHSCIHPTQERVPRREPPFRTVRSR